MRRLSLRIDRGRGPARFEIFAVEDTSAQLCWASLPAAAEAIVVGDNRHELADDGGEPGAIAVDGLQPATRYDVVLVAGGERRTIAHFTTLTPPPGALLARVTTISDMHLGERHFGAVFKMHEARSLREDGYPVRCARAAISEAVAWGGQALVVKGDLTWSGKEHQFRMVADLIRDSPIPALVTLGNHDTGLKAADAVRAMARRSVTVAAHTSSYDLPGVRVIALPTAIPLHKGGTIAPEHAEVALDMAADARRTGRAALVGAHHYPQHFDRAIGYPPGIPAAVGDAFLKSLVAANPRVLFTAGHQHRNRKWVREGVTVTVVGSTKDYPGVWGGYAVHEGGIRQVVRRVAEPSTIAWTEHSGRALGGLWRYWSPGVRSHRCFSLTWPTT